MIKANDLHITVKDYNEYEGITAISIFIGANNDILFTSATKVSAEYEYLSAGHDMTISGKNTVTHSVLFAANHYINLSHLDLSAGDKVFLASPNGNIDIVSCNIEAQHIYALEGSEIFISPGSHLSCEIEYLNTTDFAALCETA